MPIYEYRCGECGRVSEYLLLSRDEPITPVCKRCGSRSMARVLSRVRVLVDYETRLERLADPGRWGDLDENDPRSMVKMLKKLGPALGEDFPGEMDQLIEEAMAEESGEGGFGEEELD